MLEELYIVDKDWEGKNYYRIILDWDYIKRQVHLSMPGYCNEGLTRFCHELRKIMDQPHEHAVPVYEANVQYAKDINNSATLGEKDTKFIQQVTGTFLYYARAVDATMLVALSAIAFDQAASTENSMEKKA